MGNPRLSHNSSLYFIFHIPFSESCLLYLQNIPSCYPCHPVQAIATSCWIITEPLTRLPSSSCPWCSREETKQQPETLDVARWSTKYTSAPLWEQKPKLWWWRQALYVSAPVTSLSSVPSHASHHLSFYSSHRGLPYVPWTLMPQGLCTCCPFCRYLTAHSLTSFRAFKCHLPHWGLPGHSI